MYEVICYGFGGQGLKTAAQILAAGAILYKNNYASVGLKYGVQRRGGIVRAFVRMDDKPIVVKSNIYEPDCIVVSDPMLLKVVDVSTGLKGGGVAVLNSTKDSESIDLGIKLSKIGTVDASTIADEIYGSEAGILLTGLPMVAAFCKTTKRVKLESVIAAVKEKWPGKTAEHNVEALKRGYRETKVAESLGLGGKTMTINFMKTGLWRTRKPIIVREKCTNCGICWMQCPDNAVDKTEDGFYEINYEICKGCGICVEECPVGAITEVKDIGEKW